MRGDQQYAKGRKEGEWGRSGLVASGFFGIGVPIQSIEFGIGLDVLVGDTLIMREDM